MLRTVDVVVACGVLAVIAGGVWYRQLRADTAALQKEVARAQAEWAALSSFSQQAQSMRARIESDLDLPRRIAAEIAARGWTAAFQSVVDSMEPGVELRDVRALQPSSGGAKAYRLHLEGTATGSMPLVIADRFRTRLQDRLERQMGGVVKTQFDQLDMDPAAAAAASDQQRAVFIIGVTLEVPEGPRSGSGQGI